MVSLGVGLGIRIAEFHPGLLGGDQRAAGFRAEFWAQFLVGGVQLFVGLPELTVRLSVQRPLVLGQGGKRKKQQAADPECVFHGAFLAAARVVPLCA